MQKSAENMPQTLTVNGTEYTLLRLLEAGITVPRLLAADTENERLLKEYIDGPTAFELVLGDGMTEDYLCKTRQMAALARSAGLNIDYFPTNFIMQ